MEQHYHVLVVDDDTTLTNSIEYALKKHSFCVTTANSGSEALTLLRGGLDPDIILLDVVMPGLDGYETFEAIQKIKYFPIMFISGNDDSTSELRGLNLGAIDYITKPFVYDILVARINVFINYVTRKELISESEREVINSEKRRKNAEAIAMSNNTVWHKNCNKTRFQKNAPLSHFNIFKIVV